ncbi:MAG TPA: hypothetical protein VJ934_08645 [Desulfomicrobiaceae bacterium]|nr:hypothetical protein [Desulfomicrobiaceae bacterium]
MDIHITPAVVIGFAVLNLMGVLAVLAGVFLGGILVYKTRFAGQALFQKKEHPVLGNAGPVQDEYGPDEAWEENSSLFGGGTRGADEKDTDDALARILDRNESFRDRLNRSVFQKKAGNVSTIPEEDDL